MKIITKLGLVLVLLILTIPLTMAYVILLNGNFPFLHIVENDMVIEYRYINENLSYSIPTYEIKEVCKESEWQEKNQTWSERECHNERMLDGNFYSVPIYGRRIGIEIDGIQYKGDFNFDKDILCEWFVDIGDRNFEEYPCCLDSELEKEVCVVTIYSKATYLD